MARWVSNLRLIPALLLLTTALATPAIGQTNDTDWFSMGMDYYSQNKFEEAVQAYNRAIEIDPQDAEAWNNKGTALGVLGRYDEAIQAFEKAIEINSSYAEAWYNMGVVFDLQGNYYQAIRAYNEATRINPEYEKAWAAKNEDIGIVGMRNYLDFVQKGYS
jgi:tetratricopeptide (TPR) repeat protein